jgi:hypothetical protein
MQSTDTKDVRRAFVVDFIIDKVLYLFDFSDTFFGHLFHHPVYGCGGGAFRFQKLGVAVSVQSFAVKLLAAVQVSKEIPGVGVLWFFFQESGKAGVSLLVPSLSHKSFYLYRGNNPAQYFLFILHLSLS